MSRELNTEKYNVNAIEINGKLMNWRLFRQLPQLNLNELIYLPECAINHLGTTYKGEPLTQEEEKELGLDGLLCLEDSVDTNTGPVFAFRKHTLLGYVVNFLETWPIIDIVYKTKGILHVHKGFAKGTILKNFDLLNEEVYNFDKTSLRREIQKCYKCTFEHDMPSNFLDFYKGDYDCMIQDMLDEVYDLDQIFVF